MQTQQRACLHIYGKQPFNLVIGKGSYVRISAILRTFLYVGSWLYTRH